MTLVLDTSILIDIERRKEVTLEKLRQIILIHQQPAKITFVNQFEFLLGIKEREPKNKEKAIAFLNQFLGINTTKLTAGILSDLKYKYDKIGKNLSLTDLLIASLVIENNMVLLTKDKDFEKIEELKKIIL